MVAVELTISMNDRHFMDNIVVLDKTRSITGDMSEENISKIEELLPDKYKNKLIVSILKMNDVVIVE